MGYLAGMDICNRPLRQRIVKQVEIGGSRVMWWRQQAIQQFSLESCNWLPSDMWLSLADVHFWAPLGSVRSRCGVCGVELPGTKNWVLVGLSIL
jgi:hypothetical protein